MSKTIKKLVKLVKDELHSLKKLKSKTALALWTGLFLSCLTWTAAAAPNPFDHRAPLLKNPSQRSSSWIVDTLKAEALSHSKRKEITPDNKPKRNSVKCLADQAHGYLHSHKCNAHPF